MVQAGRGIENEVAGGQLHLMRAVLVFDDEFAAVVLLGLGEEQRYAEVGANARRGPRDGADRTVDVRAEEVALAVAVEERRKDPERHGRRHEQRRAGERREHDLAEFTGSRRALGKLRVLLHARRLRSRGHPAVDPAHRVHDLAAMPHLVLAQDAGNANQHGPPPIVKGAPRRLGYGGLPAVGCIRCARAASASTCRSGSGIQRAPAPRTRRVRSSGRARRSRVRS